MSSKKKEKDEAPRSYTVQVPEHRVTRREWDDTMRAALAGLIARDDSRTRSYAQLVMLARIYASEAHGERPSHQRTKAKRDEAT